MKLILSKYPHRKITKHEGDSTIIYETGKRTLDYGNLEQAFEDLVSEDEAEGESVQVLIDPDKPSTKKVPKTKGTYPTEYLQDVKTLSSVDLIEMIRPNAREVLETARTLKNELVSAQLSTMLLTQDLWVGELLALIGGEAHG